MLMNIYIYTQIAILKFVVPIKWKLTYVRMNILHTCVYFYTDRDSVVTDCVSLDINNLPISHYSSCTTSGQILLNLFTGINSKGLLKLYTTFIRSPLSSCSSFTGIYFLDIVPSIIAASTLSGYWIRIDCIILV